MYKFKIPGREGGPPSWHRPNVKWTHGLADAQTHTENEKCFVPSQQGMYNEYIVLMS